MKRQIGMGISFVAVFALCGALVGGDRGRGDKGLSLPTLELSSADAGSIPITVIVGQKIVIALPGNWGYAWIVNDTNGNVVKALGKKSKPRGHFKETIAHPYQLNTGYKIFRKDGKFHGIFYPAFRATAKGKGTVALEYLHPAVKNDPPRKKLTFTFNVISLVDMKKRAAKRAKAFEAALGKGVDIRIEYKGEKDKKSTFYSLGMHDAGVTTKVKALPDYSQLTVSNKQIKAVLEYLETNLLLGLASEKVNQEKRDSFSSPSYVLSIRSKTEEVSTPLGWKWGAGVEKQLADIRKVITDKAAGKAMDRVLKSLAPFARPGAQGITGTVQKLTGDHMPTISMPGKVVQSRGKSSYISVPVHVLKGKVIVAKPSDLNKINVKKHKNFLKTIKSDKAGKYMVALDPGEYTIVAEIDGKPYMNGFHPCRKEGKKTGWSWSTVMVRDGDWTIVWNIKDTSGATF